MANHLAPINNNVRGPNQCFPVVIRYLQGFRHTQKLWVCATAPSALYKKFLMNIYGWKNGINSNCNPSMPPHQKFYLHSRHNDAAILSRSQAYCFFQRLILFMYCFILSLRHFVNWSSSNSLKLHPDEVTSSAKKSQLAYTCFSLWFYLFILNLFKGKLSRPSICCLCRPGQVWSASKVLGFFLYLKQVKKIVSLRKFNH